MKRLMVIKKSISSEKAYRQMGKGIYTFLVDWRMTKDLIAKVVEKQFGVAVARVNIVSKPRKRKKVGNSRKMVEVGGGKKAIVFLAEGQNIAMLSPKTPQGKKSKNQIKDKNIAEESAEGKEG